MGLAGAAAVNLGTAAPSGAAGLGGLARAAKGLAVAVSGADITSAKSLAWRGNGGGAMGAENSATAGWAEDSATAGEAEDSATAGGGRRLRNCGWGRRLRNCREDRLEMHWWAHNPIL